MRSDISFLPQGKQDELAFVVRTIRNGFGFATAQDAAASAHREIAQDHPVRQLQPRRLGRGSDGPLFLGL
jgi:hypothetical protein